MCIAYNMNYRFKTIRSRSIFICWVFHCTKPCSKCTWSKLHVLKRTYTYKWRYIIQWDRKQEALVRSKYSLIKLAVKHFLCISLILNIHFIISQIENFVINKSKTYETNDQDMKVHNMEKVTWSNMLIKCQKSPFHSMTYVKSIKPCVWSHE